MLKICGKSQGDVAKGYKLQILANVSLHKFKEVSIHASQMSHPKPVNTTQQPK